HLREAQIVERSRHRAAAAAVKLKGLSRGMWNNLRLAGHGIVGKGKRVACLLGLGHGETGVGHIEGSPEALFEKGGERLSGHGLDDETLHVDRDAVVPHRSRLVLKGQLA